MNRILEAEHVNMAQVFPARALSMIDIDRPRIDWLSMAKSMGVREIAVDTAEAFHTAMVDSTREQGPSLIEVGL